MPSFTLDQIQSVAVDLARLLAGRLYAIRGTASLVLQSLAMGVTDIDILCDAATVNFLIPDIQFTESPKFKSFFGQLSGFAIPVEIMGNWYIKSPKGDWAGPFSANPTQTTPITIRGTPVRVTTVEFELQCFALMGRFTEYHKIKNQLQSSLI